MGTVSRDLECESPRNAGRHLQKTGAHCGGSALPVNTRERKAVLPEAAP
jgi:hypothetical protein